MIHDYSNNQGYQEASPNARKIADLVTKGITIKDILSTEPELIDFVDEYIKNIRDSQTEISSSQNIEISTTHSLIKTIKKPQK